jgi:hypothetical protein
MLAQCFPNYFARGTLLGSTNSHGSSLPRSRKYRVSGLKETKLKIYISELILDRYENTPITYVMMITRFDFD